MQSKQKLHSTLCESAFHKDCTCECNGKLHGIHSVQSKLVDVGYEFAKIEDAILEDVEQ